MSNEDSSNPTNSSRRLCSNSRGLNAQFCFRCRSADAAARADAEAAPNYGYLWWLEGGGRFAASGIFGQYIYVDPERRVVVVTHSLWPVAYNRELPAHQRAFVEALTRAVSEGPRER